MARETFNTLYKKLNPEQKKAVDAIEGPVMVIAGPGTGKTQILTLRIANILRRTDTSPDSILALTFTESGVFSMRKRLVDMIGSDGYRAHIYTFHGFCNDIIKRFPDAFPRIIGANNINDIDKITILKEIILSKKLTVLKPFGDNFYYIHPLRGKISELKRENISPETLHAIIRQQKKEFDSISDLYYKEGPHTGQLKGKYRMREKGIEKNKELLCVYKEYEDILKKRRLYDYEDMIVETVRALEKNTDFCLSLQEEYQYILADEHQDANNAQNRLLELLTSFHKNPNLFIVGDEKQAIYRFQGASVDNFLYFTKRNKKTLEITLKDNYRSPQSLLDGAGSLMVHGPVPDKKLRTRLVSHSSDATVAIEVRVFHTPETELLFISHDIRKKLKEGVLPHEIVVMYRNNRDVDSVVSVFEKTAIPFSIESDQHVLADKDMAMFVNCLRAVHRFGDDSALLPLLHANFLRLIPLDIYTLLRYRVDSKTTLYETIASHKKLITAKIKNSAAFHALYTNLESWKKMSENNGLLFTVHVILEQSGFLDYCLRHEESVEKLEKLGSFLTAVRELAEQHKDYTLPDLLEYLDTVSEYNIMIRKGPKTATVDGVRLMTAHRSKGLEFEYVYIIGAYDGHFGNQKATEHFIIPYTEHDSGKGSIDDERRLFYVALTRAKKAVSISYPQSGISGKEQLPSQFIGEIDPAYVETVDTTRFEEKVDKTILFMAGKKLPIPPLRDKKYLNQVFLEQGLSVTALNNYLDCPWNYFYSNLLRVPMAPTKQLMFGDVVHRVLKDFFLMMKQGKRVTEATLLSLFHDYVNEYPFTDSELKEAIRKGEKAFRGYYRNYKGSWNTNVLTEFKINVLMPVGLTHTTHLRLRGVLDKLEFHDNGRDVVVVDYKTGKPRSRNYIEGKTKAATGDYKRQLTFYYLLLDLYDKGKYKMVSGDIDFIEPDEKGRYRKEHFEITDNDARALRAIVQKTARDILTLSFWNTRCGTKGCQYCSLRDSLDA